MQLKQEAMNSPDNLTLRSIAQRCVSKGGNAHLACCPSFETRRGVYPEVLEGRSGRDDGAFYWTKDTLNYNYTDLAVLGMTV